MSMLKRMQKLHRCYLAKPVERRKLHRLIARGSLARIVELGVGDGARARGMIEVAACCLPRESIQYCGIDLFEAGSAAGEDSISLKDAYRLLKPTGARIQLVPGDPLGALARMGNQLTGTDLFLISSLVDVESLREAWYFVPRILHERSVVLIERRLTGKDLIEYQVLSIDEVHQAAAASRQRAA